MDDYRADRINDYGPILVAAFVAQHLPAPWALAFARQESDFIPGARCVTGGDARRGGSYGLLQMSLMTVHDYAPEMSADDLLIPPINAHMGALHIARLSRRFKGVLADVAAAYNCGHPLVDAPLSTRSVYVPNVVRFAAVYQLTALEFERALKKEKPQ